MLIRTRNVVVTTALCAAVLAGCSLRAEDAPPIPDSTDGIDGAEGADGTTGLEPTRASALILGRVNVNVTGTVQILVNGQARNVVIAPDHTFVIRDVPSGSTELAIEIAVGIRGSLTIRDIQPGERIEIAVRFVDLSVSVDVTRREPPSEPPRQVTETSGKPFEIRASHVCFVLPAGTFGRDVIVLGDDVKLLGAGGCATGARTTLTGSLTIEGKDCIVQDIELRGTVTIVGAGARVEESCNKCFAAACYPPKPADAGTPKAPGTCGAKDADAGACADAGGAADSGASPHDAGVANGGGGYADKGGCKLCAPGGGGPGTIDDDGEVDDDEDDADDDHDDESDGKKKKEKEGKKDKSKDKGKDDKDTHAGCWPPGHCK